MLVTIMMLMMKVTMRMIMVMMTMTMRTCEGQRQGCEEGGAGGGGGGLRRAALSFQNEDPTPQDGWEQSRTVKNKHSNRIKNQLVSIIHVIIVFCFGAGIV